MSSTRVRKAEPEVLLTRRYRFAAGHRLHRRDWDDARNESVFGRCSNPRGHGHNYVLWVTVGGRVDPVTGFVADLRELDEAVRRRVLDTWDHRNLNVDTEDFRETIPTGESIVRRVWERLEPALPPSSLRRVRLQETRNNSFEYPPA